VTNPPGILAELVEAHQKKHTFQQAREIHQRAPACTISSTREAAKGLSHIILKLDIQYLARCPLLESEKLTLIDSDAGPNGLRMASTRIWEETTAASPTNNRSSQPQPATLPSIATLTNEIPPGPNGPSSPAYPNNRSSDQWATPPQSTRKSYTLLDLLSLIPSINPFLICIKYRMAL